MFFKVWFVAVMLTILAATLCTSDETPVQQCPGKSFENLEDRIEVTPCGKPRCKLPKNANITVVMQFSIDEEVESLTTEVFGYIGGLPIPFFGVDGSDACQHVKRAASEENVSCPLPAGEYVFTYVFPILPAYPTLKTKVHWSLNHGNTSLMCFELPVAITSGSKKD